MNWPPNTHVFGVYFVVPVFNVADLPADLWDAVLTKIVERTRGAFATLKFNWIHVFSTGEQLVVQIQVVK